MKNYSIYFLLSFLSLTEISFSQGTAALTNKIWFQTIVNNAIAKKSSDNNFHNAPAGYALYYTNVDSLNVPYLVYVPKNYDSSKPNSLIVFLHGGIVSIDSFQYNNASFISGEPVFSIAEKYNQIVLYPFGKKNFGWVKQNAAFENIITEIKAVEQRYDIDKDNIFLGGISNGGSAAFWFITYHPQIFKAFYAFSALPKLYHAEINFKNITVNKPLYSINAKDDEGYAFTKVASVYNKAEAPGWYFDSVETGNHGFIYEDSGLVVMNNLFNNLDIFRLSQKRIYDSLRQVFSQVDEEDQKYRNDMDDVRKKYGGGSVEMKNLFKEMKIADSLNLIVVEKIINKYGWLGADKIGRFANNVLFMVIQHSDFKTQEQYLPVMQEAVKNNNAEAQDLALLEDRVALKQGKKQIYGSQISWNLKTNTYIIYPIIDPDNLDRRRAAVGLSPYSDYLKVVNITWNLEQYKKDLPEIERQFR